MEAELTGIVLSRWSDHNSASEPVKSFRAHNLVIVNNRSKIHSPDFNLNLRAAGNRFRDLSGAVTMTNQTTTPTFRVAVITGAGSGIGAATVAALISSPSLPPWHVALVGRRSEQLSQTAATNDPKGERTLCVTGDVADESSVKEVFSKVMEKWGRVDVLFNNAGISNDMSVLLEDIPLVAWKRVIDTNVTGTLLCTQEAFKIMKAQGGGRIINNGSVSAFVPRPNSAPYTASKHAVSGLTKSTALDGRKYNIACSQIDIGNAASPLLSSLGTTGALQADLSRRPEPSFDVAETGRAVRYMAELPLEPLPMSLLPSLSPSHAIIGAIAAAVWADATWGWSSDLATIRRHRRASVFLHARQRARKAHCLADFHEVAKQMPDKCAIRESGFRREWSYGETEILSTRLANYLIDVVKVETGTGVAVFMESGFPALLCVLGVLKAGCVVWLHVDVPRTVPLPADAARRKFERTSTLQTSSPTVLVFDSPHLTPIRSVLPELRGAGFAMKLLFWCQMDDTPGAKEEQPAFVVDGVISEKRLEATGKEGGRNDVVNTIARRTNLKDVAVVTGVSNGNGTSRRIVRDHALIISLTASPQDTGTLQTIRWCFPQHSHAPLSQLAILRGATFILHANFQATTFWRDCADHQVSVMFYSREVCKLLTAQEPSEEDKAHTVRKAAGGGMDKMEVKGVKTRLLKVDFVRK
ncbi:hypothetical protein HDU93_007478 [Gonapodya sp. JEL0774]|nr:hypothetical protein HDU93_007478 [Gonapodya sp. JEL0774]